MRADKELMSPRIYVARGKGGRDGKEDCGAVRCTDVRSHPEHSSTLAVIGQRGNLQSIEVRARRPNSPLVQPAIHSVV